MIKRMNISLTAILHCEREKYRGREKKGKAKKRGHKSGRLSKVLIMLRGKYCVSRVLLQKFHHWRWSKVCCERAPLPLVKSRRR